MKYLVSIDPGSKSAWALWIDFELVKFGRIKNCTVDIAYQLFDELKKDIWIPDTLVAVEGQWFRLPTMKNGRKQYHSANFDRVIKIVESRCWYQAAAIIHGAEVRVIDPGKWIPAMTRGVGGKNSDERIKAAAQLRHPEIKMIADEHAAVLLGDFVIDRLKAGLVL
jgi:hypothetical protein